MKRAITFLAVGTFLITAAVSARATWSICVADTRTGQVAIGSATCLENFDLEFHLPVIIRNKGVAAAQSFVDFTARNRRLIWDSLRDDIDPAEILVLLEQQDSSHQSRQYGIVDTFGRAATFSGTQNGAYANGLTGRDGDFVYSIQGNVITGQPVLDAAEMAFVGTPGGLPEKLMAAMEAARSMGGDGRCSCSPSNPPGCGSPPPNFEKSAHIGFMVVSRRGDRLGQCGNQTGCGAGDYYMDFNVAFQTRSDPDPVFQLRDLFDEWRASIIGVPDAVVSRVTLSARILVADGASRSTATIELLDWQGNPASDIVSVQVEHALESAGGSTIGPVADLGNGVFEVPLTAGVEAGLDIFNINVEHSNGTIVLIPRPELRLAQRGDMNIDGELNAFDIEAFVLALFDPAEYANRYPDAPREPLGDMNGDGAFNTFDIEGFLAALFP